MPCSKTTIYLIDIVRSGKSSLDFVKEKRPPSMKIVFQVFSWTESLVHSLICCHISQVTNKSCPPPPQTTERSESMEPRSR